MNNSDNNGCFGILIIVIYIVAWIGTETMAWNWIEPTSFWGAIKFLVTWGVFGYITQLIGLLIITGIGVID